MVTLSEIKANARCQAAHDDLIQALRGPQGDESKLNLDTIASSLLRLRAGGKQVMGNQEWIYLISVMSTTVWDGREAWVALAVGACVTFAYLSGISRCPDEHNLQHIKRMMKISLEDIRREKDSLDMGRATQMPHVCKLLKQIGMEVGVQVRRLK
jgi:hypothetical protein